MIELEARIIHVLLLENTNQTNSPEENQNDNIEKSHFYNLVYVGTLAKKNK